MIGRFVNGCSYQFPLERICPYLPLPLVLFLKSQDVEDRAVLGFRHHLYPPGRQEKVLCDFIILVRVLGIWLRRGSEVGVIRIDFLCYPCGFTWLFGIGFIHSTLNGLPLVKNDLVFYHNSI